MAFIFLISPLASAKASEIPAQEVILETPAGNPATGKLPEVDHPEQPGTTAPDTSPDSETASPPGKEGKKENPANGKPKNDDAPEDEQLSTMSMGGVQSDQAEPNRGGSAGVDLTKPTMTSNSGALQYAFPILLPKGRGFTPELELTYNSQSNRDAGLGIGWAFNIPSIERQNKHGVDKLYAEDLFTSSLSGDLSKVDGTHYAAERERGDFIEYEFSNDVWSAKNKTGLTYVFGKTSSERLYDSASTSKVFSWQLSEIVDAHDNVVKFEYQTYGPASGLYPWKISYPIWRDPSTGAETSPVFRVVFNWIDRAGVSLPYGSSDQYSAVPGTIISYQTGFEVRVSRMLQSIQVSKPSGVSEPYQRQGGMPASALGPASSRTYSLGYALGDNMNRLMLSLIQPSWESNSQSTKFEYSKTADSEKTWQAAPWSFPTDTSVHFPEVISYNSYVGGGKLGNSRMGDVDGDGLVDLISGSKGYKNTGSGFVEEPAWLLPQVLYPDSPNCPSGNFQLDLNGSPVKTDQFVFADFTGDGRTDILITPRIQCGTSTVSMPSYVFAGGASGWAHIPEWSIPSHILFGKNQSNNSEAGCQIADINGDGLVDVVCAVLDAPPHFMTNDGNGWYETSAFTFPVIDWCRYNGVTTQKAIAFFDDSWRIKAPFEFADINQDGLADLLLDGQFCTNLNQNAGGPNSINAVFVNTGSTWAYDSALHTEYSSAVPHRISGDANGDGVGPDMHYAKAEGGSGYQYTYEGMVGLSRPPTIYKTVNSQWTYPQRQGCDLPGFTTGNYRVTFEQPVPHEYDEPELDAMSAIQIADLDGDGAYDIFTLNGHLPCDVVWAYGNYGQGSGYYYYSSTTGWTPYPYQKEAVFWKNQAGKSDLLKKITYPHGGTTTITYAMAATLTEPGTTDRITAAAPVNIPVVTHVASSGGTANPDVTKAYGYGGGYYHAETPEDREFAGFQKVIETDAAGIETTTWYHQGNGNDSVTYEDDDHVSKIGLPYRSEVSTSAGNLRSRSVTRYQREQALSADGNRYFVAPMSVLGTVAEADATSAMTGVSMSYDVSNGNLIQTVEYGDVSGSEDGTFVDAGGDAVLTTALTYATATGAARAEGFVSERLVTDQTSATVNRTRMLYDGLPQGQVQKGAVTETRKLISGTIEAAVSATYDDMGLLQSTVDEIGAATNYAYDGNQLYVAESSQVIDGVTHLTKYHYHWTLGVKMGETDPSGLTTVVDYDGVGRPVQSWVKMSGETYLSQKEGWLYDDHSAVQSFGKPGASVRNMIMSETVTYLDGLDRVVRKAELMPDQNGGVQPLAAGVVEFRYDARGNTEMISLPFHAGPGVNIAPWIPSSVQAPTDSRRWTVNAFDENGRVTSTVTAAGTASNAYSARSVTATDSLNRSKTLLRDARGKLVGVTERNRESGAWQEYDTSYTYDSAGNLTRVTDADGNVRDFTYDLLGRRLTAADLHAPADATFGTYQYAYDDKGNLLTRTNPDGTMIVHSYDALGRSKTEDIGGVMRTMSYDACANGKGRLCQESTTGSSVTYAYDNRGRIASKDTVTGSSGTFSESYTYNDEDLVTQITAADGSKVKYDYRAGLLYAVSTKESVAGSFTPVISSIAYAPDLRISVAVYGDGSKVINTYDEDNLDRLARKLVCGPGNCDGETTTVNFTAMYNGNGEVSKVSSLWSDAHDASTGTSTNLTQTIVVGVGKVNYEQTHIRRGFIPFDTSELPDEAVILSAKLKLSVSSAYSLDNDGDDWISVVQSTQAHPNGLDIPDFDQAGSITNPTELSERKDLNYIQSTGDGDFELNEAGLSWIAKTGYTKLALREGHDVINSPYAGNSNTNNSLTVKSTRDQASSYHPKLEVTYTIPADILQDIRYTYDAVGNVLSLTESATNISTRDVTYAYDDLDRLLSSVTDVPLLSETWILSGPDSVALSTAATFEFGSNDSSVGYECKLDAGNWVACSSPVTYAALAEGPHQFQARAVNAAGADQTPASRNWAIFSEGAGSVSLASTASCNGYDSCNGGATVTLPMTITSEEQYIVVNFYPFSMWCSGTVTASFDGVAMASGTTLAVSGNNWHQFTLANPSVGTHDLVITRPDGCQFTLLAAAFTDVDLADPHGTIVTGAGGTGEAAEVTVTGLGNGMIYSAIVTPNNSDTYANPPLTLAINEFDAYIDAGAATSSSAGTVITKWTLPQQSCCSYWGIISTPLRAGGNLLEIAIDHGPGEETWKDDATFEFSSALPGAEFECQLDGGGWSACASPKSYASLPLGQHDFSVRVSTVTDPTPVGVSWNVISPPGATPQSGSITETYTYGKTGNILSKSVQIGAGSPVVSAYLYEGDQGSSYANPHAATSIGGVALTYDQNGNLTQYGSSTYAWDAANRLTSAAVGGATTSFGYGPGTARLSMTSGGTTTYFPSRTFTQVGTDPAGIEKRIFVDGLLVGTVRDTGLNAARHAVFTDHLGGSSVITDIFGDVSERIDYFPFGTARIDEKAEGFNERRKFSGHEFDDQTGLTYMGARYYDAATGRFLSQDSAHLLIGDASFKGRMGRSLELHLLNPQSLNSYSYVNNNPLKFTDPTGEIIPLAAVLAAYVTVYAAEIIGAAIVATAASTLAITVPLAVGQAYSVAHGDYATANQMGDLGMSVNTIAAIAFTAQLGIAESMGAFNSKDTAASSVRAEVTKPYSRPTGATNATLRESVQGKPCVTCGAQSTKMYADHKEPLVKEYYRTGTINLEKMRSPAAVQPQCALCSHKQGGEMSNFSKQMKNEYGF